MQPVCRLDVCVPWTSLSKPWPHSKERPSLDPTLGDDSALWYMLSDRGLAHTRRSDTSLDQLFVEQALCRSWSNVVSLTGAWSLPLNH